MSVLVKPVKPLVLTPIRNVRILERFTKNYTEDKKAKLKADRTADIRRKLAEQYREEKENTEQFESPKPADEGFDHNNCTENKENQQNESSESNSSTGTLSLTPKKLDEKDMMAIKLNDYTADQLKKVKVLSYFT